MAVVLSRIRRAVNRGVFGRFASPFVVGIACLAAQGPGGTIGAQDLPGVSALLRPQPDDQPMDGDGAGGIGEVLDAECDAVLESIVEQRGIAPLAPIRRELLSRDVLAERLERLLQEEEAPMEREEEERALRILGLLGQDQSLFDAVAALLLDQIAGFYDPQAQALFLLEDSSPEMQAPIMAHELFHALQDQRWGIERVRGRTGLLLDATLARTALLEGDALAVMVQYVAGGAMPTDIPLLGSMIASAMDPPELATAVETPEFLWAQLVAPYVRGLSFVLEIAEQDGWEGVDAVYAYPPSSTEQVLHPERYVRRDDPTWLEFDAGLDERGVALDIDVMGELMMQAVLSQLFDGAISDGSVEAAVSGWDGDRMEVWELTGEGGRGVVVWASVWDSVEDAAQFHGVVRAVGSAWVPYGGEHEWSGPEGEAVWREGAAGAAWLERWGDVVLVVADRGGDAGPSERDDTVRDVVLSVWGSLERYEYPDLSGE